MGGGARGPNQFLGPWGDFGGPKQRGIIQYTLASNRQRAGTDVIKGAIFNGARRFRQSAGYVLIPMVGVYYVIQWAEARNHFLNSKEGRKLYGDHE